MCNSIEESGVSWRWSCQLSEWLEEKAGVEMLTVDALDWIMGQSIFMTAGVRWDVMDRQTDRGTGGDPGVDCGEEKSAGGNCAQDELSGGVQGGNMSFDHKE